MKYQIDTFQGLNTAFAAALLDTGESPQARNAVVAGGDLSVRPGLSGVDLSGRGLADTQGIRVVRMCPFRPESLADTRPPVLFVDPVAGDAYAGGTAKWPMST